MTIIWNDNNSEYITEIKSYFTEELRLNPNVDSDELAQTLLVLIQRLK